MLSSKIAGEPNILFVPKTRKRKRGVLRIIIFLVVVTALIIFLVTLVNDNSGTYSFF